MCLQLGRDSLRNDVETAALVARWTAAADVPLLKCWVLLRRALQSSAQPAPVVCCHRACSATCALLVT